METKVTRCDYVEFLLNVYFGSDAFANPIKACVHRAYLDFNRTIHGIGRFPNAFDHAAIKETLNKAVAGHRRL